MKTGKYSFYLRFLDDAILPEYKGSTFRGVFGHSLKKSVCALKLESCENCILKENCLYPFVFEKKDSSSNYNVSANPHPIVIVPPESKQKFFKPGDMLKTEIILFGNANEKLPYFVLTFQNMGEMGIGKKIKGQRSRFLLEKVTTENEIIFDSKKNTMVHEDKSNQIELSNDSGKYECSKLTIILNTPLRVNFGKEFPVELDFKELTRNMLRRISSLMNTYGNGEPDLDYKGLINKASEIKIENSNLYWKDWQRYSNRQNKKMFMGGLLGDITYSGNLTEFVPLIEACSKVHIGKNTVFGLGGFSAYILEK
jgi:hypothetical protein